MLCKAFLATAAVCLDSAARRCGVRLWICVRKTVSVLGTKQNRNLVNNHYEKTLARTENFLTPDTAAKALASRFIRAPFVAVRHRPSSTLFLEPMP